MNSPLKSSTTTRDSIARDRSVPLLLGITGLQRSATGRIDVFDQLRGLLLFWMVLGHAYHLTGRPASFPLDYLRLGAATDSFVMLTGFVIAWIYTPRPSSSSYQRSLIRRTLFVLAVAYASNLVFALARDFANREASLDNLIKMATFQRTWTISSILVATSLTIVASVALLSCVKKWSATAVLLCSTLALVGVHSFRFLELPPSIWLDGVMDRTVFGHSLIDLTIASAWAFSMAAWLSERRSAPKIWAAVILGSITCYAVSRWHFVPETVCAIARPPSQFLVSLWVVSLIGIWMPFVGSALSVPGRHSLLVFLLHRVVLQAVVFVAGQYLIGAVGASILVVVTSSVCWLAAYSVDPLRNSSLYQRLSRRVSSDWRYRADDAVRSRVAKS